VQGLRNLAEKLHPGGVFGLWSNDPPDAEFTRLLESVFHSSEPLFRDQRVRSFAMNKHPSDNIALLSQHGL
jgi:hypothetical protein